MSVHWNFQSGLAGQILEETHMGMDNYVCKEQYFDGCLEGDVLCEPPLRRVCWKSLLLLFF